VVKAFGMEDYESNKFKEENYNFYKVNMKNAKRTSFISPFTEFLGGIGMILVLGYGSYLVLYQRLDLGNFIFFLMMIGSLVQPFKRLSEFNSVAQQAIAAGERIFSVLHTETSVKEARDPMILFPINREISFKKVSFVYNLEEGYILKDINITIGKGEIVAFVGPTGSGKSTLLDLLPRFYDPAEGSIEIDGQDIKKVTLKSLRQQMGIVTQEIILFNDTIRNNIDYGQTGMAEEDIIAAAKAANAHKFIMALPDKYDTIIGERGLRLSGGEKQRMSIARAILKNPPILILDEATSALDSESEKLVQEALTRLMEHRTTLVIAHRLSTITHTDRIVVIDKGRIVEQGRHKELLEKDGMYKRLYDMQFVSHQDM
jgi:subfamily B ATP-binding cassette protein MsbA